LGVWLNGWCGACGYAVMVRNSPSDRDSHFVSPLLSFLQDVTVKREHIRLKQQHKQVKDTRRV